MSFEGVLISLQHQVDGNKIDRESQQIIDGSYKRARSYGRIESKPVQNQWRNGANERGKHHHAEQGD